MGSALIALALAGTLAVPFLPQTEALCGGAAAAMVFRYWGERHADVQQFAPLVDVRAGGIDSGKLAAAVRARGWMASEIRGSIEAVRRSLQDGAPLILLVEDRPSRYHYIVAVGMDEGHVLVHDPTWGPSRPIAFERLLRAWAPTGFWALAITPARAADVVEAGPDGPALRHTNPDPPAGDLADPPRALSTCEQQLEDALLETERQGLAVGERLISNVRASCPGEAAPIAELAALRFAERRWTDAASLASDAVALDATNEYAWDVLGSSRFMTDDAVGALHAWNQVGKPTLDAVNIEGLTRTRYTIVAQAAGLVPNTLLTSGDFARAARRLQAMPTVQSSRISVTPASDGFATADVAVVEREGLPRGPLAWVATGLSTVVDRELRASFVGSTGQGELWQASWRWWRERPRVALGFAAPRTGWLPGVWRVDGSWEAETYAGGIREERTRGGVSASDWLTAHLRYEWSLGLDSWTGGLLPERRQTVAAGGLAHVRTFSDRLRLTGTVRQWLPTDGTPSFRSATGRATFRTSAHGNQTVLLATVALDSVSAAAPLTLWPGAGGGHAREALLRAHPLLDDNVITGTAFGQRVVSGTLEAQRWFSGLPGRASLPLVRWGIAGFVDTARTSRRLSTGSGEPLQIDAGAGFRLGLRDVVLRVDFAHGLRDDADAVTVAFEVF